MISLYWEDLGKTIFIREMDRAWTWEEYDAAVAFQNEMISKVQHSVVVIVDARKVRQSSEVPANALLHLTETNMKLPSQIVAQVIVSECKWLEVITAIAHHVIPETRKKFFFARKMEKARKQITKFLKPKRRRMKPRPWELIGRSPRL